MIEFKNEKIQLKDTDKSTLIKYLSGKNKNNIILAYAINGIISVNKKTEFDFIDSWNDILSIEGGYKQKYLINFLQYVFYKNKIDTIIGDKGKSETLLWNIGRNKDRKNKVIIIDFPSIKITWGNFWTYQFKKFNNEIEKDIQLKRKKTKKIFRKYYKDIIISQKLDEFFLNENKNKNWNKIKKNLKICGGNTINSLLIRMGESLDIWGKDMIKYIGKYNENFIKKDREKFLKELNEIYSNKILKKGTFLYALFNIKMDGIGKGEILLLFLIYDAKIMGGSESYDIMIGNIKIEVKNYSSGNDYFHIKLGTHGSVTKFSPYRIMLSMVDEVREIAGKIKSEDLKKYLGNTIFCLFQLVISEKSYKEFPKNIGEAILTGEIPNERLEIIKYFCILLHEFFKQKNIKEEFNSLSKNYYVKYPLKLQKDLDKIGEIYNKNLNIDYILVFGPSKIIMEPLKNFLYGNISQAGVKIIPKNKLKERQKKMKIENIYRAWKKTNRSKSFIEYFDAKIISDDR